ncbi:MAG: hypothetical protein U0800_00630 [Isosphaeraceae bacterium]
MTIPNDPPNDEPPPKVSRQGQGGGPKTAFGKAASSRNATTHGLSGRVVRNVPDSFRADVDERMTFYVAHHQPQTDDDTALCGLAALGYVQHREAIAEKLVYLKVRSYHAEVTWENDRIAEVAALGSRLPKRPDVVAPELGRTLHGAMWLLERWVYLVKCLDAVGKWNDEDASMAYDLLGRDLVTRQQDPDRLASGCLEERRAVAEAQVRKLRGLVDGPYRELDPILRGMAVAQEHYLDDPVFRRLTRYEHRALNLNRDCLAELERRRIARGLDAYNPDGTIATPPPKPGRAEAEGPEGGYQPVFYRPVEDEAPEPPPAPAASHPDPYPRLKRVFTDLRPAPPRAPEPAPTVANEAAEPRPRPNAEQLREAHRQRAEDRKADRREKDRIRAERKAARAARRRNR